jgi:hypothetical protein
MWEYCVYQHCFEECMYEQSSPQLGSVSHVLSFLCAQSVAVL